MSHRVLIAGLFHETHTFLEGTTGLDAFEVRLGDELLVCAGDASPMGGVLEAAKGFGWTVLPTVDFRASPSATVADEVVETFGREFRSRTPGRLGGNRRLGLYGRQMAPARLRIPELFFHDETPPPAFIAHVLTG